MIQDTIRKIEAGLRAESAANPRRDELLGLLDQLKQELRALEGSRGDDDARSAQSAARATEQADEDARTAADAAARASAAERLTESVRDFESTHPELRSVVQAIANALASAGL